VKLRKLSPTHPSGATLPHVPVDLFLPILPVIPTRLLGDGRLIQLCKRRRRTAPPSGLAFQGGEIVR
jgi:hypothetical protein